MTRCSPRLRPDQRGTASVELIAVIPALILAILVLGQLALSGHALWSAAIAARAGARAAVVGDDAERAARRALPGSLRETAEVTKGDTIAVRVDVPRLMPAMPRVGLTAETTLGGEGGG